MGGGDLGGGGEPGGKSILKHVILSSLNIRDAIPSFSAH